MVKRNQLAYLALKFVILPLASLLGSFRISHDAISVSLTILVLSLVHFPITPVELSISVFDSIFEVSDVVVSIAIDIEKREIEVLVVSLNKNRINNYAQNYRNWRNTLVRFVINKTILLRCAK